MAVQTTPYVVQALSHSGELFRRELQSGLPLGSAGGVVPATPAASSNVTAGLAGCSDLKVSPPASGMTVLVAAGQAIVPGSQGSSTGYGIGSGYGYPTITLNGASTPTIASNAHATTISLTTQGAYYCYNDNAAGAVSVTISPSNPSNPRIDVVGCQVEDAAYAGVNNDWKLAVVTGTAAASPTVPALPANFLPLALVWVPTAATSIVTANIVDLRVAYNRNPFRIYATNSTSQPDTGGVATIIRFDTLAHDLTGSFNTGTFTFTCPVAGIYQITAGTVTPGFTSGDRYMWAYKNGGVFVKFAATAMPTTGGNPILGGSVDVWCNTSDTLAVFISTPGTTAGSINAGFLAIKLVDT